MELSIIIPSYNSSAYLHRCLDSVLANKEPCDEFEILVVDSSPTPLSEKLKQTYPEVQFIVPGTRLFAGAARNLGVKNSRNSVLCFLDSDCLWSPQWLTIAKKNLERYPNLLAMTGRILYEHPDSSMAFALHLMEFHEFLFPTKRHPRFLASGNVLLMKSLFDRIGGFREDIPMCTDFTFTAKMSSEIFNHTYYIPELSVTHLAHLTDESDITQKLEQMGYWRGFVENQIPSNLQIKNKYWFKIGRYFLGDIFWLGILVRALKSRSTYFRYFLLHLFRIRKLCRRWAKGFSQGYEISEQRFYFNQNQGGNLLEWPERARLAVRELRLIPLDTGSPRLADYGCGLQTIKGLLSSNYSYIPIDCRLRSPDTIVCNFNQEEPPGNFDVGLCLGVLEYLDDPLKFLSQIISKNSVVIFSYNGPTNAQRKKREGWVNHLDFKDIEKVIFESEAEILSTHFLEKNERLFVVRRRHLK